MQSSELDNFVTLAQQGRPDGVEWIMRQYSSRLYGYFLRSTGCMHEAEDLMGELWVRLLRTLGSYSHTGRFDQWLFRIAANLVRDRIRRKVARGTIMSLDSGSEGATLDHVDIDQPEPIEVLKSVEARHAVQAALAKLDEKTREMILMRHFGQMSFAELAKEFNCPIGTVLARVHRGLQKLRQMLEGYEQ
ncbi:MAG TPA: RNA polymerase sigma factor [Phycisphaerae bacterium]|nr:RNA polymerase sigma factor [Phycisphaerae bacterium]HPS53521.1 RNA polymerase sigma factor [Phycisphaerae bacterium]